MFIFHFLLSNQQHGRQCLVLKTIDNVIEMFIRKTNCLGMISNVWVFFKLTKTDHEDDQKKNTSTFFLIHIDLTGPISEMITLQPIYLNALNSDDCPHYAISLQDCLSRKLTWCTLFALSYYRNKLFSQRYAFNISFLVDFMFVLLFYYSNKKLSQIVSENKISHWGKEQILG